MGTRHLTVVKDHDGEDLVVMYGQWDGYLSGHGKELKEFLDGFVIVNGITLEKEQLPKIANGMGCLAAQLVGHFKSCRKDRAGNDVKPIRASYHLEPPGTRDYGEEYIYTITHPVNKDMWYSWDSGQEDVGLHIEVRSGRMTAFGMSGTAEKDMNVIYSGPVSKFDPEKNYDD